MPEENRVKNSQSLGMSESERDHALDRARQEAARGRKKSRLTVEPNATWLLAVIFAIVLTAVGLFIYWIYLSYANRQYADQLTIHVMSLEAEDSYVHAEYEGIRTNVRGQNLSRVITVLSVSDRRMLGRDPVYNPEDAVTLRFSSGAVFTVAPDPAYDGPKDRAFIIYEFEGQRIRFALEGYKTMEWLTGSVVPDGIYGPNQVIKGVGTEP